MQFSFDLISDLHSDTWENDIDFKHKPTSLYCVVAGDVSEDRKHLVKTLTHLGQCYQAVFYIDGNSEHRHQLSTLGTSYRDLSRQIDAIPNVVYLQDNVIVIDGLAILGTNGWWGFNFDHGIDPEQSASWYQDKENLDTMAIHNIKRASTTDANYMIASVKRLQTHRDISGIVMVTHTVPDPALIAHDVDLEGSMRFNVMGNRFMRNALSQDTESKIKTWCFGHYHGQIDQTRNGIRYVNNCRGRGDSPYSQWAYNPLRIVVDY
jgi:hypothetical protein